MQDSSVDPDLLALLQPYLPSRTISPSSSDLLPAIIDALDDASSPASRHVAQLTRLAAERLSEVSPEEVPALADRVVAHTGVEGGAVASLSLLSALVDRISAAAADALVERLSEIRWSRGAVVSVAAALKEKALVSRRRSVRLLPKLCRWLPQLEEEELPAFVYQVSLLAMRIQEISNGRIKAVDLVVREILGGIAQREKKDDGFGAEKIRCEGNILRSLEALEKDNAVLTKAILAELKARECECTPFALGLLMGLAQFENTVEANVHEFIKKQCLHDIQAKKFTKSCLTVREALNQKPSGDSMETVLIETVSRVTLGWEFLAASMTSLGFVLMDTSAGEAGEKVAAIGIRILTRLFRESRELRTQIMDQIHMRIFLSTKSKRKSALFLLEYLVAQCPDGVKETLSRVHSALEYISSLQGEPEIAILWIRILMPIMAKSEFIDSLVVVLRKLLFYREVELRRIAVEGVVSLAQSASDGYSTESISFSQASSQASRASSQLHQSPVFLEIIQFLKKALTQQAEVRITVYRSLGKLIRDSRCNVGLQFSALELLKSQFTHFYESNREHKFPFIFDDFIDRPNELVEPLDVLCQELISAVTYLKVNTTFTSDFANDLKETSDLILDCLERLVELSMEDLAFISQVSSQHNQTQGAQEVHESSQHSSQISGNSTVLRKRLSETLDLFKRILISFMELSLCWKDGKSECLEMSNSLCHHFPKLFELFTNCSEAVQKYFKQKKLNHVDEFVNWLSLSAISEYFNVSKAKSMPITLDSRRFVLNNCHAQLSKLLKDFLSDWDIKRWSIKNKRSIKNDGGSGSMLWSSVIPIFGHLVGELHSSLIQENLELQQEDYKVLLLTAQSACSCLHISKECAGYLTEDLLRHAEIDGIGLTKEGSSWISLFQNFTLRCLKLNQMKLSATFFDCLCYILEMCPISSELTDKYAKWIYSILSKFSVSDAIIVKKVFAVLDSIFISSGEQHSWEFSVLEVLDIAAKNSQILLGNIEGESVGDEAGELRMINDQTVEGTLSVICFELEHQLDGMDWVFVEIKRRGTRDYSERIPKEDIEDSQAYGCQLPVKFDSKTMEKMKEGLLKGLFDILQILIVLLDTCVPIIPGEAILRASNRFLKLVNDFTKMVSFCL